MSDANGGVDLATQNRGPALTAMYWVFVGVATLTVALRYAGRIMIKQTGWDDHTMAFTLVCLILLAGFTTAMCAYGGAKHQAYIPLSDLTYALRYNFAAQACAVFGYATGKISIGLLILRIIGPHTVWRKRILFVVLALSMIFTIINIIFTFAQCTPTIALWHPELVAAGQATCWKSSIQPDFGTFLAAWNVVADAFLAVLPISIFWNLKITLKQKISCTLLLGLGLLAAICGAIKTQTVASLGSHSDLTWLTFDLFAWSGGELFVLIVCGSVPPVKPLYDRIFNPARVNRTRGYTAHSYSNDNSRNGANKRAKINKYGIVTSAMSTFNDDRRGLGDEDIEIGAFGKNSPRPGQHGIVRTTEVSITSHAR